MADEDAKSMNDLFKLVEKLTIQLNEKDKELATNKKQNMIEMHVIDEELAKEKQEKQKLSADLELVKAQANRADELETELAKAQEMIEDLQLNLWESFPSPNSYNYLKIKVKKPYGEYQLLFVTKSGQLRLDDRPSFTNRNRIRTTRSLFQFTKDSNGTFAIYSLTKNKYLKSTHMYPSRVGFYATNESSAEKFMLVFHQHSQQSGFLVDISTLTGLFLHMENDKFVVSNSCKAPADKFMID